MRWQSRLRCAWFREHDHHCHHELTSGWVIEVWTDPLLERLKAWWQTVTKYLHH